MNQEKLSFYTDEARLTAYENKKRRQLTDMAIRNNDPSYRVSEDEPVCCSCHVVAPCSWCVKNLSDEE